MNDTLTAIAGVRVGHAHDVDGVTGCTTILFDSRSRVNVSVAGGSPATYNIGALLNTWRGIGCDAIFLAGGSIYGLDAAAGVRQCVEDHVLPYTLPTSWRSTKPLRRVGYRGGDFRSSDRFSTRSPGCGNGLRRCCKCNLSSCD